MFTEHLITNIPMDKIIDNIISEYIEKMIVDIFQKNMKPW